MNKTTNNILESEKIYNSFIDDMPDGLILLDKNFTIIHINHSIGKFFQSEPEKLLGNSIKNYLKDSSYLELINLLSKAKTNNPISNLRVEIIFTFQKNNEFKKICNCLIKFKDQKPYLFIQIPDIYFHLPQSTACNDIYNFIIDKIPLKILLLNQKGQLIRVNSAMKNEFSKEESLQQINIFDNKSFQALGIQKIVPEVLKGKVEIVEEAQISFLEDQRNRTEKDFWYKIFIYPVFDYTENECIIFVLMQDISYIKRKELYQKEFNERLFLLSNASLELLSLTYKDPIYEIIGNTLNAFVPNSIVSLSEFDETTNRLAIKYITPLMHINKFFHHIFQKSSKDTYFVLNQNQIQEIIQKAEHFYEIKGGLYELSFGDIPYLLCKVYEKLFKIKKVYGIRLYHGGKLLGTATIMLRGNDAQLNTEHTEVYIYLCSMLLQRIKMEEDLSIAKQNAEKADQLKSSFLSNISHEIRTPLTAIKGFLDLLNRSIISQEKKDQYIAIINDNLNNLLNIFNDIIDLSKIESKHFVHNKIKFSRNSLLTEIYNVYCNSRTYSNKLSKIEFTYIPMKEGINDVIYTDINRLRQVVNILITNAIKFTDHGSVKFGFQMNAHNRCVYFVKDTGIGIREDQLKLIFDRFSQADESNTRLYGGLGLGLALAKGIVNSLGGQIWVESKSKAGSTFYFYILEDLVELTL